MSYEEIKKQIIPGDYNIASILLNKTRDNVRLRVFRKREDTLKVIEAIIENRKKFIQNYKLNQNN